MAGKTLYDKVWDSHVVHTEDADTVLLYIDRHLIHEVTSPQAFEGLQLAGRKPWRTDSMLAVADHNVPTTSRSEGIDDPVARLQIETLDKNCDHFAITEFKMSDRRQGIVHVNVMATQTLLQKKSKSLLISVDGQTGPGVTAKDIVLAIIGEIGTAGGTGYTIEFGGDAIQALSMEGRWQLMTLPSITSRAGHLLHPTSTGTRLLQHGETWSRTMMLYTTRL